MRQFFTAPPLALMSEAVIAGNSPAVIWMDSESEPRTAFLWDKTHCLYLAGDADNKATNRALRELITEEILHNLRQLGIFKVYYSSTEWEHHISDIFQRVSLTLRERSLLTLEQFNAYDWRARVPEGFSVRHIDVLLLANQSLKNVQSVTAEIESCWPSLLHFFRRGFGFCLLLGSDEIVC